MLRSIELKISRQLMSKATKVIREDLDCIKIVYTGSIENRYGIKNIVEGFRLLQNEKKIVLEIYGRGDYEEELKAISLMDSRVRYKGYVSNKEILTIQRDADFLINARSSKDEFVKYSFPSKTLEYMLSGTPLITTMLPGIPAEYANYVFVLENNELEVICEMLEKVISINEKERS